MRSIVIVLALILPLAAAAADAPKDPREGSVTKRDFFFYACVHEYMRANGVQNFDGSVAYAVEFSKLSGDEMDRLYNAATAVAEKIGAPNYKDPEHGLHAVLVDCERAARKAGR